ncbi:hypothetical protein [Streptomyces sp. NPDC088725]|uniref:hypothetical protein n=1 Tax=Streptomyces sp. NPDC088725 TaxID=3365873 RepID=UPI003830BDD4
MEGDGGHRLLDALVELRTAPGAVTSEHHPEHCFRPLPLVLGSWCTAGIDITAFHRGLDLLRPRYAALGLRRLLPLDRVLIGARSARPGAFGGFHHPNQGYRHLQMVSVITVFGDMTEALPTTPDLALLDLLRAYAHDCLHYGSYRRYALRDGQIYRSQYGINYRRPGRTYSSADRPDTAETRNLGVVMEGACDREARRLTGHIATLLGTHCTEGPEGYASFGQRTTRWPTTTPVRSAPTRSTLPTWQRAVPSKTPRRQETTS